MKCSEMKQNHFRFTWNKTNNLTNAEITSINYNSNKFSKKIRIFILLSLKRVAFDNKNKSRVGWCITTILLTINDVLIHKIVVNLKYCCCHKMSCRS